MHNRATGLINKLENNLENKLKNTEVEAMPSAPIGIFDSGIGGMSVAQTLMMELPHENIIYFGDTAHMPYGGKTKEEIKQRSKNIIEYLIDQHVKAIIVACNTATAAACEVLSDYQDKIKIFNVIDPVVDYVVAHHAHHKVGLICTDLTYKLGIFEEKIERYGQDIRLISLRASQLAYLIETEFENTEKLERIISEYFYHHHFRNVSAVILGCTHYVWLKEQFLKLNPFIDWVEPSHLLAGLVRRYLTDHNLVNDLALGNFTETIKPKATFCQSGDSKAFFDLADKLIPPSFDKKYINQLHLASNMPF